MKKYILLAIVASLVFIGCTSHKRSYADPFADGRMYSRTVKELNNVVLQNNFPPIIASRNYAYACIAGYETMALGDKRFNSLAGQIKHLPALPAYDTMQVNFHYASLLALCKVGESVTFPAGSMKDHIHHLDSTADAAGMSDEMIANSKRLADSVAAHIIRWSKGDNYAKTRTAEKYNITSEEGRWVPTPPGYFQALEPHWMEIRPMVMDSASQFKPKPPSAFDMTNKNSDCYLEAIKVKNAVDSLTPEQQHIALFWDDLGNRTIVEGHVMFTAKKFTPTGHWMNIVGIASEKAKVDFETTAEAYAKTSIAMFDAFIQCWDEKYRSNKARPETLINKYIDADWRPFLQTPPFPEYTCGHSTVSAAAAETLTSVFGDHFQYTDTSELEFGIASRSFNSFRDAALENNWARFYGGIHFHASCIESNKCGIKVGGLVNDRLSLKKEVQ